MPEFTSLEQLLEYEVLGNTFLQLASAIVIFVAILLSLHIFKKILIRKIKKLSAMTSTKADDALVGFLDSIGFPLYGLVALFVALRGVQVPESLSLVVQLIFLVAIVFQIIRFLEGIIMIVLKKNFEENKGVPAVLTLLIRVILWLVGLLLILSNLGIDITSLVASLGIGGIAVSLALQNILSDLFSSFSIAMDKPFEEGDYIVVGTEKGTVKKIGLKSTRIQALEGEEIVMSNNELTTSRIQNYKKMKKRRIVFLVGCVYGTTNAKVRKAVEMIKEIVEAHDETELDRVHFSNMGDYSLDIEVVYFMKTSDYTVFMDTQQELNLSILEAFEKEKIEMPFPTQTVVVEKP